MPEVATPSRRRPAWRITRTSRLAGNSPEKFHSSLQIRLRRTIGRANRSRERPVTDAGSMGRGATGGKAGGAAGGFGGKAPRGVGSFGVAAGVGGSGTGAEIPGAPREWEAPRAPVRGPRHSVRRMACTRVRTDNGARQLVAGHVRRVPARSAQQKTSRTCPWRAVPSYRRRRLPPGDAAGADKIAIWSRSVERAPSQAPFGAS